MGDRIAIMGNGTLKCCGSSLYLKKAFGVGYSMTLEKTDVHSFKSDTVINLVKGFVADAKVLSDAGKELSFQLPFSASPSFGKMFTEFDGNLARLNLRSYGISVTTLEEVFIRISQLDSNTKLLEAPKVVNDSSVEMQDVELGSKGQYVPLTFSKLDDSENVKFFFRHMVAMLNKRAFYFVRDKKTWIFQYIIPVLFVLVGMIISYYNTIRPNQPLKPLSTSLYNVGVNSNNLPLPYANATKFCPTCSLSSPNKYTGAMPVSGQSQILQSQPGYSNYPLRPVNDAQFIVNMSSYMFSARNDYQASTFAAISFVSIVNSPTKGHLTALNYLVHSNYTAVHASHVFNTLTVEAALKQYNPTVSLKLNLHSLPNTYRQAASYSSYNTDLVVTFIMLAVPCIPAAFATFVVRERETRSKQQQVI